MDKMYITADDLRQAILEMVPELSDEDALAVYKIISPNTEVELMDGDEDD